MTVVVAAVNHTRLMRDDAKPPVLAVVPAKQTPLLVLPNSNR